MNIVRHYLPLLYCLLLCSVLMSCEQNATLHSGSYKEAVESANDLNDESFESAGLLNMYDESVVEQERAEPQEPVAGYATTSTSSTTVNQNVTTSSTPKKTAKKIIKNANVRCQVDDIGIAYKQINALVAKHQAYISKEEQNNRGRRANYDFTIRVPFERFDTLLSELSKVAIQVDYKNVNARDVTEEFVDIKARLQTKRALEARYIDILKKADSVKDMLTVEKQLQVVREEIEAKEGRLRYLSDQVGQSTIKIKVYQLLHKETSVKASFLRRVKNSFYNGWEGLLEFFVEIVTIWPFILFLLLLMFFIAWLLRRRRKRKHKERLELKERGRDDSRKDDSLRNDS